MREVEIAIVGGGPAGLRAALEASAAGAEVVLIDEYPTLGGHYYKQVPETFHLKKLQAESEEYVEGVEMVTQVKASPVEVLSNTLVWSVFQGRILGLHRTNQTEELKPRQLILAPGAQEAPVAFPGWTLPGVMMGGAAQALMVTQRVLPGRRQGWRASAPAVEGRQPTLGGRGGRFGHPGSIEHAPRLHGERAPVVRSLGQDASGHEVLVDSEEGTDAVSP